MLRKCQEARMKGDFARGDDVPQHYGLLAAIGFELLARTHFKGARCRRCAKRCVPPRGLTVRSDTVS